MATAAPAAPTANKAELLAIADAVAREKLIDKAIVIEAMEDAIQRAARARYGAENDIRAKLDPTPATFACGACSKWSRSRRIISSRST
jgi:transcription termination/antitermination protein NusA